MRPHYMYPRYDNGPCPEMAVGAVCVLVPTCEHAKHIFGL